MPWTRIGDFSKKNDAELFISREIKFENRAEDARILEVHLLKYKNQKYQLIAKARDEAQYKRLLQQAKIVGLPEPDFFDKAQYTLRFECDFLNPHAAVFLQTIKIVDPSFREVKAPLKEIGIDLSQNHNLPLWLITGSFKDKWDWGWGVNRELNLKNTSSMAGIKELSLMGYQRGDYQIIVKVSDALLYQILINHLNYAGFLAPDPMDAEELTYRLYCSELMPHGLTLIDTIRMLDSQFSEIQDQIYEELNAVIEHDCRQKTDVAIGILPPLPTGRLDYGTCLEGSALRNHGFFGDKSVTPIAVPNWSVTDSSTSMCWGTALNKKLEFKNSSKGARIKELSLLSFSNGSYELVIKVRNSDIYNLLVANAKHSRLLKPDLSDKHLLEFKLECFHPSAHGEALIKLLRSVDPHFAAIEECIIDKLGIKLTEPLYKARHPRPLSFKDVPTNFTPGP